MEHHQRSPVGNEKIVLYMLDHFRLPKDFATPGLPEPAASGRGHARRRRVLAAPPGVQRRALLAA